MTWAFDRVGGQAEIGIFGVDKQQIVAFARSTNDTVPSHVEGMFAPPVFAVVPALDVIGRARRVVFDGFAFHGEHDLILHRAIEPDTTVLTEARVIGVQRRSIGTVVVTHAIMKDQRENLIAEHFQYSLAKGAFADQDCGRMAPAHGGVGAKQQFATTLVYPLDTDQTLRFAEASGDRSPYTFDADAAKALGLPGPIVHGICTMAFVSRALVDLCCGGDSRRLRRLAMRFSGLLLMEPGQTISVRLGPAASTLQAKNYVFEAVDRAGTRIVSNGWAEVAA